MRGKKTAAAGRAAKRFECTGMMPFSADALFEPSSRKTTATAAIVTATKARLSSCPSMALPIAISSHNGNTADVTASPSNTTNNSASKSISSVKNILPTPEKKTSTRKRKQKIFSPPYFWSKSGRNPK